MLVLVVVQMQEQATRRYPQGVRDRIEGREAILHARVSFYQLAEGGDCDAAVKGFEEAVSAFEQLDGNQGLKLLIDRRNGKAIAITLWESRDALKFSSHQASWLRKQVAGTAGLTIENVEHYEVVRER